MVDRDLWLQTKQVLLLLICVIPKYFDGWQLSGVAAGDQRLQIKHAVSVVMRWLDMSKYLKK